MKEVVNIKSVIYSPEFISRLLQRFLSGALESDNNGIKFELIYWLLPIVMNDDLRSSLKTASKRSSIEKLLFDDSYRYELIYLDEYICNTRELLNAGLIYLNSYVEISISDYIKIDEKCSFESSSKLVKEYYRAAFYLGQLLAKEDYKQLYLKAKVTSI